MWGKIYGVMIEKGKTFPNWDIYQKEKKTFKHIYFQVDTLFSEEDRSDGTPYFFHLLETAYILIEESELEELTIEHIVTALLHDIIEDTDNDYNSLWRNLKHKKKEIAFGVHLISKSSLYQYIKDNCKNRRAWDCHWEIDSENIDPSWNIIDEDTEDPKIVAEYNRLKKKHKPIRNRTHFENYTSLEVFKEYARREAQKLEVHYPEPILDIICRRCINVKLADRLHNLRTLWHMSHEKINGKIDETEQYLLEIADEVNPVMADKLREQIKILRKSMTPNVTEGLIHWVKGDVESHLGDTTL
jgi:(p)ppGpp synthase/HD superfamily hydrolase